MSQPLRLEGNTSSVRTVLLRVSNLGYNQTVDIGQFKSGINRDPVHSVEMDLMMHWITEPGQRVTQKLPQYLLQQTTIVQQGLLQSSEVCR